MATINGTNGDDSLNGTSGADTIDGLQGDDTLLGQGGDDVFVLSDGFGNDSVTGGEAGETEGDKLDMSGLTSDTTVDLRASDPETFTVSDGTATAHFSEDGLTLLSDAREGREFPVPALPDDQAQLCQRIQRCPALARAACGGQGSVAAAISYG